VDWSGAAVDSFDVQDVAAARMDWAGAAVDSFTVQDVNDGVIAGAFEEDCVDSFTLQDTPTSRIDWAGAAVDSFDVQDVAAARADWSGAAVDSFDVDDVAAAALTQPAACADSFDLQDSCTARLIQAVACVDSFDLQDTTAARVDWSGACVDSFDVDDVVGPRADYAAACVDSFTFQDLTSSSLGVGIWIDDRFDEASPPVELSAHTPDDGGSWSFITDTTEGWTKGSSAYKLNVETYPAGEGVLKMDTDDTVVGYKHSYNPGSANIDVYFDFVSYDDIAGSNSSETYVAFRATENIRTGYGFGYDVSRGLLIFGEWSSDVWSDIATFGSRGSHQVRTFHQFKIEVRGSDFYIYEWDGTGWDNIKPGGGAYNDTTHASGLVIAHQLGTNVLTAARIRVTSATYFIREGVSDSFTLQDTPTAGMTLQASVVDSFDVQDAAVGRIDFSTTVTETVVFSDVSSSRADPVAGNEGRSNLSTEHEGQTNLLLTNESRTNMEDD
jgi:hypothetical protein